jgi:hypothetical protein
MVDRRIILGADQAWKASVIRSEIRSRAARNCALPLFLHSSHQRDTAHRPVGTGRPRARRRFGYWGEQIGHPCDQRGHHLGTRRPGLDAAPSVGSRQSGGTASHSQKIAPTGSRALSLLSSGNGRREPMCEQCDQEQLDRYNRIFKHQFDSLTEERLKPPLARQRPRLHCLALECKRSDRASSPSCSSMPLRNCAGKRFTPSQSDVCYRSKRFGACW